MKSPDFLCKALSHALLTNDTSGWSAVTIQASGLPIIIHNISHGPARQESDLFHELAHVICKHPAMRIVSLAGFSIREYSESQEEEAAWLGGCLHLPRIALLSVVRKKLAVDLIMQRFNASEPMLRYRRNVTGIDLQRVRTSKW